MREGLCVWCWESRCDLHTSMGGSLNLNPCGMLANSKKSLPGQTTPDMSPVVCALLDDTVMECACVAPDWDR